MMNNIGNIMGMVQQFKANPMQFLLQKRLNVPQNVAMDNPQAIMDYLLQSGQINQQQINQAYQIAQRFK